MSLYIHTCVFGSVRAFISKPRNFHWTLICRQHNGRKTQQTNTHTQWHMHFIIILIPIHTYTYVCTYIVHTFAFDVSLFVLLSSNTGTYTHSHTHAMNISFIASAMFVWVGLGVRVSERVCVFGCKVFSQLISLIGHLLDKISALLFVWKICNNKLINLHFVIFVHCILHFASCKTFTCHRRHCTGVE